MKRKKKASPMMRWSAFDSVITVICIVVLIVCIYPLIYVVSCSFSDSQAVLANKVRLLPIGFETDAYETILKNVSFWRGVRNSAVYAIVSTLLLLYNTVVMAYPLTRQNLKFKRAVVYYLIVQMFVGGGMIPSFIIMTKLGLYNNPWVMILPAYSIGNVMVCKTYMQSSLGEELIDAAFIDGANHFKTLWRIVVPLSKPVLAVFAMYQIVGVWNSWFNAQLYITKADYQPVQIYLKRIIDSASAVNEMREGLSQEEYARLLEIKMTAEKLKYACIVLTSLPIIMIYPMFQKHFAKGFLIGSLKG